jgi:predicted nucleotidyltransferase
MFRMGVPPIRIEILSSVSGIDFASAFSRRSRQMIDGIEVNVVALEDLKANKKASGRLKDLADLEKLEEVSQKRKPGRKSR